MFYEARSFNSDISGWNMKSARSLKDMFYVYLVLSSAFHQNLCPWGDYANQFDSVENMFYGTNCLKEEDPDLSAVPPGPFCSVCHNVSVKCIPESQCATRIKQICNTCTLTTPCFVQTTQGCCKNGPPSEAYRSTVRAIYKKNFCPCPAVSECADRVWGACRDNCPVDASCVEASVKQDCCKQATKQYMKQVRSNCNQKYCFKTLDPCIPGPTPMRSCVQKVKKVCNNCNLKADHACLNDIVFHHPKACCLKGPKSTWIRRVRRRYRKKYCQGKDFMFVVP